MNDIHDKTTCAQIILLNRIRASDRSFSIASVTSRTIGLLISPLPIFLRAPPETNFFDALDERVDVAQPRRKLSSAHWNIHRGQTNDLTNCFFSSYDLTPLFFSPSFAAAS
jgi:hypothetical protein